jgi:hypothetical protein
MIRSLEEKMPNAKKHVPEGTLNDAALVEGNSNSADKCPTRSIVKK